MLVKKEVDKGGKVAELQGCKVARYANTLPPCHFFTSPTDQSVAQFAAASQYYLPDGNLSANSDSRKSRYVFR